MIKSSLVHKYTMALSGLFLVVFLLQHFTINLISVISKDLFNEISHFMGNNFLVQAILQPILIFGVIFHFVMGFILEFKNRKARTQSYTTNNGAVNSSWMSRNMIWSGTVILSFLILHFIDFWFPEITYKYIEQLPANSIRYYEEMIHKFVNPVRVIFYVVSFIFLMFHLLHGFSSSFQSIGFNNKYSKGLKTFTTGFSVLIPLGFIFIAIFHYLNA